MCIHLLCTFFAVHLNKLAQGCDILETPNSLRMRQKLTIYGLPLGSLPLPTMQANNGGVCSVADSTIGRHVVDEYAASVCWQHAHPDELNVYDFSRWSQSITHCNIAPLCFKIRCSPRRYLRCALHHSTLFQVLGGKHVSNPV